MIFIKCSILLSGPNRTSEHPSYLFFDIKIYKVNAPRLIKISHSICFLNIREKNTELSIAPLEQVLKAWNRSLEGISSKADKDIVRNLCYEITERPHENHGTKIKAIGVLARLGKDLWRNGLKTLHKRPIELSVKTL